MAARTRKGYGRQLDILNARFGRLSSVGFTRVAVMRFRDSLPPTRQGNYQLSVFRLVIGFAYDSGHPASHTARRMRGAKLKVRDACWTKQDEAKLVKVATAPIRLAFHLGLYTGQREAGVLTARWGDIADGWLTIGQRKTGRLAQIPVARKLATELARARVEQRKRKKPGLVIVIAERKHPYKEDNFRHRFADAITGLTFQDLRRSAVVRLAEAGCTVPEIASITGHTTNETQKILDTCWRATRPQARAAIARLEAHRRQRSPRQQQNVNNRDS